MNWNKVSEELQKIINDKTSGSSDILFNLNKLVEKNSGNLDKIFKIISEAEKKLKDFAAVSNYLSELDKTIREKKNIKKFSETFESNFKERYPLLYLKNKNIFSEINSFLTLSNSKTIFELVKLWVEDNPQLKITVAESRPGSEGKILAKKLLKTGINVQLIIDAQIHNYIQNVDAVIIGADKVLKNKNVVNKTGSKAAAILCRYFKKPFYVITTKDKFISSSKFKPEEQNPSEIWNYQHKNLEINNYYFEEVEKKLITKILTN